MRTAESVVLTDWPPGPVERKVSISRSLGVDVDLDVLGLGQHGDGRGRGVDAALGLGLGDALDAVGPALVLEDRVGAVALDAKVTSLKPPTSAGDCESTSVENPSSSA